MCVVWTARALTGGAADFDRQCSVVKCFTICTSVYEWFDKKRHMLCDMKIKTVESFVNAHY